MKILITRPLQQAKKTAKEIKNGKTIIFPLIKILNKKLSKKDKNLINEAKALAFTSTNAVHAFAKNYKERNFVTYAIGDKTSEELKKLKFRKVISANGSLKKLKALIKNEKTKPVIYFSGNIVTEKIEKELKEKVIRIEIYKSTYPSIFSQKIKTEIAEDKITHALFYSEQTAKVFIELAKKHKIIKNCQKIKVLALSRRIAKRFKNHGFKQVKYSVQPSEKTLLGMLKDFH